MPVSRNSQSLTMAEVLKDYPSELEIGTTMESFQKALDSQRELFHSQIHQLRTIIVTQCHLTGVNPLSQEMAAGALSVKIGKRPRDLLNPKAVKYMQSLFSIKDAISKKESREIGALFGVTVTQVRDFFASQKSRVRKIVRLSRERAIRSNASEEAQDGVSTSSDLVLLDPVPLNTVGPSSVEDAPGCSNQDEILPSIGESDKDFVANIFDLMRKEETYAGQVKLMQWILQIENPSVLCWFMTKGGIIILATWLSQAAIEEQTSVIFVALKVLCHLPLSKALPAHMAIILQSVNRLRFYRMADLSNRARVLLSKWSKIFAKNQALNKPNGTKSYGGAQRERELRQRIDDLVGDDLWQSTADAPDNALCPSYGNLHDMRNTESPQAVKLLTSLDDLNKKQPLGISHNKARRKVQMVEQPRQKTASKNQQLKPVSVNQQRPITADEIQKAKMRAQFMQNEKIKAKRPLLTNDLLSASETYKRPKLEPEKKAWLALSKNTKQSERPSDDQKPRLIAKESIWEQCRKVQIPWHIPPVIWIDDSWSVGTGASSKEMAVQNTRMRREKETLYKTPQEIPANPKDPWDTEMDYDDTLTPDIPTEQPPDADDAPTELELPESGSDPGPSTNPSATIQLAANGAVTSPLSPTNGATPVVAAEPDIELLAVLLRNPELVFALTSGQGGVLSPEQTVKLLDMLRNSEAAGASKNGQLWKAVNSSTESKVEVSSLPSSMPPRVNLQVSLPSPTPASRLEVSLPSPTPPSSKPGPSVWAPEPARNLFSRTTTIDTTLMRGAATTVATIVAAPPARPQAAGGQLEHHQFLSSNPTGLANASAPQHYPHTTQPSSFTDHHHRNFHDTSLQQRISPPLHGNNVYNANLRSISIMPNTPRQLQPQPLPPLPHLVAEDTSISRVPKARQRYYASNSYNQSNQNAYNHPTMVGPSRAGLDWGPEDGPARYLEQVGHGGRGYGGGEPSSRSSLRGYGSVAPDRVRHPNSGGFREPNAQWSRDDWRWRDRERDRDWRR